MELNDGYGSPLGLTSQFRFCGNPFRLDFYKFCSFGCKYCFARHIGGQEDFDYKYAKFDIIQKYFEKAFESDEETKDIIVELLRHKTPIHVGGLSDPFQPIEFRMELNYKLIQLSNKYNYPLIFSTKTSKLPQKYWDILNPKLHAFQISLFGYDEEFIRKYEDNTPTPKERIEFLKQLRNKGFWCSIRIQPMINLEQAVKLCDVINGIASYVTIEHLKINTDNPVMKELFKDEIHKYKRTSIMRNLELDKMTKIKNINEIKKHLPDTKVGVGDNDLHFLSQSRCCCGVDTINENFDNYLKYNLTYFSTESQGKPIKEDETIWLPKCNCANCVNGDIRIKNTQSFKDYVDSYCGKFSDFMGDNCSIKQEMNGVFYDKKTGDKFRQSSIFDFE